MVFFYAWTRASRWHQSSFGASETLHAGMKAYFPLPLRIAQLQESPLSLTSQGHILVGADAYSRTGSNLKQCAVVRCELLALPNRRFLSLQLIVA